MCNFCLLNFKVAVIQYIIVDICNAILSEWILPVILKAEAQKQFDLSDQSSDGEDYKKPRDSSLNDSFTLNSVASEDVFTGSLQSSECDKI